MLSRVAAAEAPRTHNRRRVTGSSGRRREGRESERQRPNMSRHLFYSPVLLLLLVVVMSCVTGAVTADGKETTEPKFEWKDAKSEESVTVESLGAPGLLKVATDVFVVAEAQCKEEGEEESTFNGIASQLLMIGASTKPVDVLEDAKSKTQILEENSSANVKKMDVSRPTTVTKESEVYMLVGRYSGKPGSSVQDNVADDSGLLLVTGKVSGGEASNKKLTGKVIPLCRGQLSVKNTTP
ncbi:trans-sialidase, putative [Trypanosoma cruzi marinkellei]|uniref:Trans-sialidase, putative n=1 Tax=Trypanosoma cruzi marinkellei TaxID=85056 RepID=K2M6X4_TRYCR|nr:trans-sialidase, putative [Trypanosoma cruzi marinkellei]